MSPSEPTERRALRDQAPLPATGRDPSLDDVLITADVIQARVRELAAAVVHDVRPDRELHLIGILTGAFVFMADLVRAMDAHVTLDFMAVSSYGTGARSSGEVRVLKDLDAAVEGRHVVIVEDIVDTGVTLAYLREILLAREPRSLRTVTLLSKPARRRVDVPVEHVGFEIENRFVVGYGLDHAHRFRNLPHIALLRDV